MAGSHNLRSHPHRQSPLLHFVWMSIFSNGLFLLPSEASLLAVSGRACAMELIRFIQMCPKLLSCYPIFVSRSTVHEQHVPSKATKARENSLSSVIPAKLGELIFQRFKGRTRQTNLVGGLFPRTEREKTK